MAAQAQWRTYLAESALAEHFLGNAPDWYKLAIAGFLAGNVVLDVAAGPAAASWALLLEFIFTLVMALRGYPLAPGGLLTLEGVLLGLAGPSAAYDQLALNLPVLLLLIFMVASVHFMRELLEYVLTSILVRVRSKIRLGLALCFAGAFMSAFLDALTVTAVLLTAAHGLYNVYQRQLSIEGMRHPDGLPEFEHEDLAQFRGFLRNLMMHGAVGTALGGALTLVGEPQNLLIGQRMGWDFVTFFVTCAPVSLPVLAVGFLTCWAVERWRLFGYGYQLPPHVRSILEQHAAESRKQLQRGDRFRLATQAAMAVLLLFGLAFHVAEVGLLGLAIIVILSAMNGVVDEHEIGDAFRGPLPFVALLAVFFTLVAVIDQQQLFAPVLAAVRSLQGRAELGAYFLANGVLSSISDNVFVGTIYITETLQHFDAIREAQGGVLTAAQTAQLDKIAVAINMGTNIPSVATPNGQAAFLFLLTSALAPLIRLSYMEMVRLAAPYTVTMVTVGFLATRFLL